MLQHYGCLAALALAITAPCVGAQVVIRDGVSYHEAGNVIVSIFPDSLDGVHVHVDPRGGTKSVQERLRGRFDPVQLIAWLKTAEPLALDSVVAVPQGGELQTPLLRDLDGTIGLAVGRLWRSDQAHSTLYWVLHGADRPAPLLIEADSAFSRRVAAALRLSATHSHLDSVAFASGLVEPIGGGTADSAVQAVSIPVPAYPPKARLTEAAGVVEVRYVVDMKGRADMTTFEVLGATDAVFVPPVRAALSRARFRPAHHQGAKVRRRVWQRISFRTRSLSPDIELNPVRRR